MATEAGVSDVSPWVMLAEQCVYEATAEPYPISDLIMLRSSAIGTLCAGMALLSYSLYG